MNRHLRWTAALLAVFTLLVASCSRDDTTATDGGNDASTTEAGTDDTSSESSLDCDAEPTEATEIGVTEDEITVSVMADVGSPLAPGLFQANFDAMNAYAEYINANGGIACRDLVVEEWDSKMSPEESKNGLIDACTNVLAMVGGSSLFNADPAPLEECVDGAGEATGLPDMPAVANDTNHYCAATTYPIASGTETCPVTLGEPRPLSSLTAGSIDWFRENVTEDLHGLYVVPADLPSLVQGAMGGYIAHEEDGVVIDEVAKVLVSDEQSAYTQYAQVLKSEEANYVYNEASVSSLLALRQEAESQGVDTVDVWSCALGCYGQELLDGGAAAEGTYVWMQFLPFEEAAENEQLAAYLDGVGRENADSFGAQAWQAAVVFTDVLNGIAEEAGVNGITRAAILEAYETMGPVDAGGWMGPTELGGEGSNCLLILQVQDSEFVRVHPEEPGTFDCDEDNRTVVDIDPEAEAAKIG